MTFWTPDQIKSACGGSWLARAERARGSDAAPITGVSTDTRTLRPGQVFLALRGQNHDGHDHLAAAVRGGSPLLIVDSAEGASELIRNPGPYAFSVVRVADTGRALLRLAGAYRKTLESTRVIAVGGSNGKTTTTRLIEAVLSASLRGTASAKSYNNAVGVPLTILSASPSDQYLICEVGTNAPGEIALLAAVVEPEIAVITSIGREHLELLGSPAQVAHEEAAILSYLRPGGWGIVTADAPALTEHLKCVANLVTFGRSESADLRLTHAEHITSTGPLGEQEVSLSFVINGRTECRLPLLGEHNAMNAIAAFAVGKRLGIDEKKIVEALGAAKGPGMRLEMVRVAAPGASEGDPPVAIINDAYNANPDSMLAALQTFLALTPAPAPGRRRVLILGEMLELGAAAEECHREIGDYLARVGGFDLAVLVGHHALHIADRLYEAGFPARSVLLRSDLEGPQAGAVAMLLRPGDSVLLKGSRRMRLERIVEALLAMENHARRTGIVPPPAAPAPASA